MRLTAQVLRVPRIRPVLTPERWRAKAGQIMSVISQDHAQRFEREVSPEGQRWAPLNRSSLRRSFAAARRKVGGAVAAPVVSRDRDGALIVRATRPVAGHQKTARVRRTRQSKILQDTGLLKASVVSFAGQQAIREVGSYFVVWGTRVQYARTHQYGDPARNIPERPFIGFSRDARQRVLQILRSRL